MLEKLPYELLAKCMKHLGPLQKLACLYVSKSWNEKVREFVYEELTFFDLVSFEKSRMFFGNNKEVAKFVKRLFVLRCKVPPSIYMTLPLLFPNIRLFCFTDPDMNPYSPNWDEGEAQIQFSRWSDTIENVTEVGLPICVKALLSGGACPNLKKLEYGSLASETPLDPIYIIQKLQRCAPNLTHLRLQFEYALTFDIQRMEELLENTPNLEFLYLKYPYFAESTMDLNLTEIQAHPRLETLIFHEVQFEEDIDQWITYFSSKFVHLKQLCIIGLLTDPYESFYDGSSAQIAEWMSKLPKLEMYCMQAFILTESIIEAMDKSGMQLKNIDLGPYYSIGNYYKLLLNSKQKNSLESISSSGSSYRCIVNDFQDFTVRISEFKNLKHLKIFRCYMDSNLNTTAHSPTCYSEDFPLDQILRNAPKLETLSLNKAECVVEYDKKVPMPNCKLRELLLIDCKINAVNCFSHVFNGYKESWKYLKNTVLPNTRFNVQHSDEVFHYMQSFIPYQ